MSTTPYAIIAGPATVYLHATAATAAQAVNAADAAWTGASWVNLGLTEGGVKVKHTQTVDQIYADQRTGPQKAIRSAEGLEISFALANLTLANYALLLNGATVSSSGTPNKNTMGLYQGLDVAQFAIAVVGPSPYMNANVQYWSPYVVQTDSPEVAFTKDGKAMLQATFVALEDPAASSASVRFGTLVAQTS